MIIIIKKAWPGPKGFMAPGEYRVPQDISLAYAKCIIADESGEWKQAKALGASPNDKLNRVSVENKSVSDSGGTGSESNAGSGTDHRAGKGRRNRG